MINTIINIIYSLWNLLYNPLHIHFQKTAYQIFLPTFHISYFPLLLSIPKYFYNFIIFSLDNQIIP